MITLKDDNMYNNNKNDDLQNSLIYFLYGTDIKVILVTRNNKSWESCHHYNEFRPLTVTPVLINI